MDIRPLHTDDDYRAALAEMSALVDQHPERGTPESDRLEILSILIEHYERSMEETAHLLRSPANAAYLERSIAQLREASAKRLADLGGTQPGIVGAPRRRFDAIERRYGSPLDAIDALDGPDQVALPLDSPEVQEKLRQAREKRPWLYNPESKPMSTKATLAHHDAEDGKPAWRLYEELFESGVVYLELEGVQVDVVMIDGPWAKAGTVLLRLPVETAQQLGLHTSVPAGLWARASVRDKFEDDSLP